MVKNPLANAGDIRDMGSILGQEDPLEESMATHSSILAWRIPWTGPWQVTIHRVAKKIGHNLATKQQQLMVTLHNRQKHLDNKTFR